jgi:pSer/pThr/pTyr-binding forkhead associated (FHA) protein
MISFDVNLEGQEYVIREGKNTLGRAREADISVFYDDRVSATHATIVYRNGECRLRDEMTNNGTFLNGQDIGPGGTVSLKHGDVLRVGRCTFKLFLLDPGEVSRLWPHLGPGPTG